MEESRKKLMDVTEEEIEEIFSETSRIVSSFNLDKLSSIAVAAKKGDALSDEVEFYKWMSRNFKKSGIFESNESMQDYINRGITKEDWLVKQIQAKGYEWDWMNTQRNDITNIHNTFDAGDVSNRSISDVTKRNILTGKTEEFQMKAYTSSKSPDLKNTPKDITIVTNSEKIGLVEKKGYIKIEEFQDSNLIKNDIDKRIGRIKDGTANTSYNFKNITKTAAGAGIIGTAIGIGTELIKSFKAWKVGKLSDEEYIMEVLKSGVESGATTGITTGMMIPVTGVITCVGISTLLTIPIAFVVGGMANKVVSSFLGRDSRESISNFYTMKTYGYIKDSLGNMKEYREHVNMIEEFSKEALYTIEYHQLELRNMISEHLKMYEKNFEKGFKEIIVSTLNNDTDGISNGLDIILNVFGQNVKFKTTSEFDEFFMDEDSILDF